MAGLYGNYRNSLDPKGRLAIPAKMRNALPDGQRNQIYITRGIEKCITGYSYEGWEQFRAKLDRVKVGEKTKRQLKRQFIGKGFEATFDKQGRITLPAELIRFAELESSSEVVVLGSGDVIEIWNPTVYEAEEDAFEDTVQSIMGEMDLDSGDGSLE